MILAVLLADLSLRELLSRGDHLTLRRQKLCRVQKVITAVYNYMSARVLLQLFFAHTTFVKSIL